MPLILQEVRIVYVDNTHITSKLLEECFPGMPSDGGVKEDLFHVIQRMRDCLADSHSLKGEAWGRKCSARAMPVWLLLTGGTVAVVGMPGVGACRPRAPHAHALGLLGPSGQLSTCCTMTTEFL